MRTLVCPYCGCSLVRLGISKEKAATYSFVGTDAPTIRNTPERFFATHYSVARSYAGRDSGDPDIRPWDRNGLAS